MKEIILPNLEKLDFERNGRVFHGGAQMMYKAFHKRLSGCGPTSATNIFIYLSQTKEKASSLFRYDEINYDSVLSTMDEVFDYITPGIMGLNRVSMMKDGALHYASDNGINLNVFSLDIDNIDVKSHIEVAEFIFDSLNRGVPLAFLNLNSGELKNLDSWHWVMIVGIRFNKDNLYVNILDEGNKKEIDLKLWLETTNSDGGFVSFEIL